MKIILWENNLQIGPSLYYLLQGICRNVSQWFKIPEKKTEIKFFNFQIKARNIWAIWTYVFVQRKHLPNICNIESEVTASGVGGVMVSLDRNLKCVVRSVF